MAFTITCPICGSRDLYEFRFGNEDRGPAPDHQGLTREVYSESIHMRVNTAGPQKEWWCHTGGCGVWFTVWRDTMTNREVSEPEESL